MKATFFHTADLHIGRIITNKNFSLSEREKRRVEIWNSFENIINRARDERPNFLFISGDMMNPKYCTFSDIKRISTLFESIIETNVIITCGNNDFFSPNCLYSFISWPDNVHMFKNTDKLEMIEFEEFNLCVYSVACGKHGFGQVVEQVYDVKTDDNKINVLLLHANAIVDEEDGLYINPQLIKHKFDYCAMGHVHKHTIVENNIVYPGIPENFEFEISNDSGGIVVGEITEEILQIEFRPISKRKFVSEEILIEGEYGFDQILDLIKNIGHDIDTLSDYVKIKLSGVINSNISVSELLAAAKELFYYIEFEDDYTFNKVENLVGINSTLVDNYISQFEHYDTSNKTVKDAFELGLRVLRAEEVNK